MNVQDLAPSCAGALFGQFAILVNNELSYCVSYVGLNIPLCCFIYVCCERSKSFFLLSQDL